MTMPSWPKWSGCINKEKPANEVLATLEKVDMSLVKNDVHNCWMEQYNAVKTIVKK